MADHDPQREPDSGLHANTGQYPQTGEHTTEEGQRAWLAQLDRKLGTRTYAGAAAAVLALAAGIVAIVLAIDARDNSATTAQLDRVREDLAETRKDVDSTRSATDGVDSLEQRVSDLEDKIKDAGPDEQLTKRVDVLEDDIEELREQISELESDSSSSDSSSDSASDSDSGG